MSVVSQLNEMTAQVKKENRSFSSEELEKFDNLSAEITRLDAEIESEARFAKAAELTEKIKGFGGEYAGEENIDKLELRLTSEDFGFFTQQYPCSFYRFGVKGDTNQDTGGLHSPTFCIDEKALLTGAGGLAYIARRMMD